MPTQTILRQWSTGKPCTCGQARRLPAAHRAFSCSIIYRRNRKGQHRSQAVNAFKDPSEVVQEALVALRKADTERLSTHLAPGLIQLGQAERQVLLVGGQPFVEDGPLANFSDVLDTGARRLLPGNLLRRCKVLSTLRISEGRFQQRVAVTACTGEEGILDWTLEHQQGSWWVCSIRRDPSGDTPLPEEPHPRHAPEAVVLAQLARLQRGDVSAAARFHVYATIPRGEDMSQRAMATMLQSDHFLPIMGHIQVELGASALPSGRKFVQEVTVLGNPRRPIRQELQLSEGAREREGQAPLIRQSFIWTLGLRDCGNWLVQTVEAVLTSL